MVATMVVEASEEKKAENILILDMRDVTVMTDYFVICSAESDTQRKAIREGIIDSLRKAGVRTKQREGNDKSNWILLDYGGVVVHIFTPSQREYYDLERLWGDAPRVSLQEISALVEK